MAIFTPRALRMDALAWTVLIMLSLGACSSDDDPPAADATTPGSSSTPAYTLQLLHFSDMDGSDTTALDSVTGMSALVNKYRAEYPESTVLLSSGDNVIPGPRFNAANDPSLATPGLLGRAEVGRVDIAFINEMGLTASALGNHDMDLGPRQFRDLVNVDGAWSGTRFPYLAYNVDWSADSNTAPLVAPNGQDVATLANKVSGWAYATVGGQRIGLIGASSPSFPTITSMGGLTVTPPLAGGAAVDIDALAARIQQGVDEMTSAGIDKIILMAHMQTIAIEKAVAAKLRNVDIIIAGGSNTLLADDNDALRAGDTRADTYPLTFTSPSGEPVLVVNTDADFKYLGRLVAGFDAQGVLLPGSLNAQVNGVVRVPEEVTVVDGVEATPRIVALRDAVEEVLMRKDGSVFGSTDVFLDGRRASVRNEETNFGNLSADANLWYATQSGYPAQVSLKNGGGIRAEIGVVSVPAGTTDPLQYRLLPPQANPETGRPAGGISQLAIETALKFNNLLWVFDVSAVQLKSLLEHGVANLGSQGRFPQVGGMRFSFDPAATAQVLDGVNVTTPGQRIRSLVVGAETVVSDGAIVGDPQRTFRMVTLNFLATIGTSGVGGDGYPFPVTPNNLVRLDEVGLPAGSASFASAGSEQDAFAEYMLDRYETTPFDAAETPAAEDERIQNLAVRADTVLSP